MERVTRIELAFSAWEADVLPLNYTREGAQTIAAVQRLRATSTPADLRWPAMADRFDAALLRPLLRPQAGPHRGPGSPGSAAGAVGLCGWLDLPVRSVLDVGAGPGYWGDYFATHHPQGALPGDRHQPFRLRSVRPRAARHLGLAPGPPGRPGHLSGRAPVPRRHRGNAGDRQPCGGDPQAPVPRGARRASIGWR